jgi:hypothetical protein
VKLKFLVSMQARRTTISARHAWVTTAAARSRNSNDFNYYEVFGRDTSRLAALVLIVGNVLFAARLFGLGESALAAAQGESYRAYRRAVPRLVPALSPRVPAAGGQLSLRAGMLGEVFFWCMALGLAVFAATLNLRSYFWVLGSTFAAYFASYAIIRRRS